MFSFFKLYGYRNLRNKLIVTYVLNVTDIVFTLFLLDTKMFIEINPVLSFLTSSPLLSIIAKVVLPAGLLLYLYLRLKKATPAQLRTANIFICAFLIAYALINILHITNVFVYFFYIL